MKTADPPLEVVRAKDSKLYTREGHELIDAISSWWVNLHGHCHPAIAEAISRQAYQLEQVIFAGFTHAPAIQLAETLMPLLPNHFAKIFFSDDGSTSVEVALKMALQYWHNQGRFDKTCIIALENAYHGDTFGAMSVAERNAFNEAFSPLLFHVKRLPLPNADNIDEVMGLLNEWLSSGEVAALIVEPLVQGASGMLMYDAAYLDQLFEAAQAHQVLCIADEVMTGFGRTGTLFACEQAGVVPDIMCLSKGITGGSVPLAVTLATPAIFDAHYSTDRARQFFHSSSYTANPIACAAALANLDVWAQSDARVRVAALCEMQAARLTRFENDPRFSGVRRLGTIAALDLNIESRNYLATIGLDLMRFFNAQGLVLRPLGATIYVLPPYCVSAGDLDSSPIAPGPRPGALARGR